MDAKYSRPVSGEHLIYAKVEVNQMVHLLSIRSNTGPNKMVEVDIQQSGLTDWNDKHYYFLGKVSAHLN